MSFADRQTRYQRLRDERPAWKLLAADQAPFTIAVLAEWFEGGEPEISIDRARVHLEAKLIEASLEEGDAANSARQRINRWVDAGYLREQNQKLAMTAGTQSVLQFIAGLDDREMTATASRLESVGTEIRKLLVDLSPDIEERKALLHEQINELKRAIAQLDSHGVSELGEHQKRERVRNMFAMAMGLTQDFRYLEDELRRNEAAVQQRILDDDETRGGVLISALDAEDALNESPAGQAFNGFYELLSTEERGDEFRFQIKRLISLGAGSYLTPEESQQLLHLVRNLLKESERVLERRRAGVDRLRGFIESGIATHQRAIARLLRRAAQMALKLRDNPDIGWHDETPIRLRTGRIRLSSPSVLTCRMPEDIRMTLDLDTPRPAATVSDSALDKLARFRFSHCLSRTRDALRRMGPRTLGELTVENPVYGGLDEVMALVRIGFGTQATRLGGEEWIYFTDTEGRLMRALVPTMELHPDRFPEDLSEF